MKNLLFIGLVCAGATIALAEDAKVSHGCYVVIPATPQMPHAIKIDQCSGSSWILVRTPLAAPKGNVPDTSFRWYPIQHSSANEAILGQ